MPYAATSTRTARRALMCLRTASWSVLINKASGTLTAVAICRSVDRRKSTNPLSMRE